MAYTKGLIKSLHCQFQLNPFTYKDASVHFATLNALVSRGWLEKVSGNCYRVTTAGLTFSYLEDVMSGQEFFTIRLEGDVLGMMCSIKGADLLDCWGKPYVIGNTSVEILFPKEN